MRILLYIIIFFSTALQAQDVKVINADVELSGRDCDFLKHGPCRVNPTTNGSAILRLVNNELTFKLYKAEITREKEIKIFGKTLKVVGKDTYTMEEPFELGKDLRAALNLSKETIIPAGQYPVLISKDFVEIKFRIE